MWKNLRNDMIEQLKKCENQKELMKFLDSTTNAHIVSKLVSGYTIEEIKANAFKEFNERLEFVEKHFRNKTKQKN